MGIKERYKKILYDLYFSTDFKPSLLYSLIIEDKFGKVSYGNEFVGTRRKFFVSDVDGVLNEKGTPSLFECYLKNHSNLKLRRNSEKLCEIARKIGDATRKGEKFEIKNSVKELEDEIKNYDVTIEQHLESCIRGARNLKLASKLIESFYEIRRMNYKIILNSGSPQDCLNFLVRIKSLPVDLAFGSRWYFKNGRFFSIEPNLACRKLEVMEKALESEKDLFKKSIFITDDLRADKEISLAIGMAIKVGNEKERIEHPLSIECSNMKDIVDTVKKWEILHIHYFTRSPELELKVLEKVKDLKKYYENFEKDNFIETAIEISNLTFFDYQKDKLKEKIFEIKNCRERIKDRMNKILIEMERFEPLIKASRHNLEVFEKELRKIVEEMKKSGVEWREMLNII